MKAILETILLLLAVARIILATIGKQSGIPSVGIWRTKLWEYFVFGKTQRYNYRTYSNAGPRKFVALWFQVVECLRKHNVILKTLVILDIFTYSLVMGCYEVY